MIIYNAVILLSLALMVVLVASNRVPRWMIGIILLAILLLTGSSTLTDVVRFVDWDVLGLIVGMGIFTVLLEESGLMELTARFIRARAGSPSMVLFWIILAAGLVSIILENVTVVLLFAPIAYRLSKKLGVNPVPVVIGIALSSNMAGSATMIGDPPAIITAGYFNLAFTDFIWYHGRPSMFFLTLIPMIVSCYVYSKIVGKEVGYSVEPVAEDNETIWKGLDKIFVYEAILFLSIKITLLSIRHIIHIPLTLAALIGVGGLSLTRIIIHRDTASVKKAVRKGVDLDIIVFLIGVFVLSGAFAKHGLAAAAAKTILSLASGNLFVVTSLLIWLSVAVSAVMDNTPYVVTMLPIAKYIAIGLNVDPVVIAWALLVGATLGGSITYIGASANLVAVKLLEKKGYKVTFSEFIRKSIPFNMTNILLGWLLYTIFWIIY